ncbi:O-antigen ligase family protein [uncultured Helicobacter sp.]|uniref:O-antigen ligase family protein n=1 Tax=uncultured Helicobacter sp. TaxID=175537 RepID=UPI00374F06FB
MCAHNGQQKCKKTFVLRYYEEFVLVLFCVGIFLYGIGLSNFSLSLRAQSFFHIGGLLYIIFAFRHFGREDLWLLRVPLITFGIVIVLGLLSYFDDVMPRSFAKVFASVNTHIINYLVLFVIMFLYMRYAKRRNALILLWFFGLLCAINVGATLVEFWQHNFRSHNVPFFFKAVFTYNIWLLAPMALCISGVAVCRHKVLKAMCVLGALLTLVAMFANGERSFLVASFVMVFVPFFVWHYRYKGKILPFVFAAICIVMIGMYHYTKTLPERHNFAHMLDNFWAVWQTPPIQMGKYDKLCFNGRFECAEQSTQNGKAEFSWEHSSLARLAMSKSTFEAFLDAPFAPRLVGVFQIGEYLWQYYERHPEKQQNRVYMSVSTKLNGYNHSHNFILELLFCYGIFGFGAIVWFWTFGFSMASKAIRFARDSLEKFFGLYFYVFMAGMIVCGLFESFYGNILEVFFILTGCLFGFLSFFVKPPRAL